MTTSSAALDAGQSAISTARGLNEISPGQGHARGPLRRQTHLLAKPFRMERRRVSRLAAPPGIKPSTRRAFAANIHELEVRQNRRRRHGQCPLRHAPARPWQAASSEEQRWETPLCLGEETQSLKRPASGQKELRCCGISKLRNVEVQEGRLERDREKTAEVVVFEIYGMGRKSCRPQSLHLKRPKRAWLPNAATSALRPHPRTPLPRQKNSKPIQTSLKPQKIKEIKPN